MTTGAPRSPEELDPLLEDAFVLRDRTASHTLFCDRAVLVESGGLRASGAEAIGAVLAELWRRDRTYVARAGQVLRAHDTALLVSRGAIHVVHRAGDGTWRAAISLLDLDKSTRSEDP